MDEDLATLAREGDPEAQCMLAVAHLNREGHDRRRALYWLRRSASAGFAPAQYALANLHNRTGSRAALRWFKQAARQGDVDAQLALAYRYAARGKSAAAQRHAAHWFRLAAHAGEPTAQFHLARALERGAGVPRNFAKAAEWYRHAARGGDLRAQVALGRLHSEGLGVSKDPARAVRWYRRAAESGSRHAQCIVGLHYLTGNGAKRDVKQALGWLRAAAEQGYPLAQYALGAALLSHPSGAPIGLIWLGRAAQAGHADAAVAIARVYCDGTLVPRDLRRARASLKAPCAQRHPAAFRELAETFVHDSLARPDWRRAVPLFRKAAYAGDAWAAFRLGVACRDGLGLARDARRARYWLARAAALGIDFAELDRRHAA